MAECITKSEWQNFFDNISKTIKDNPTELEVEALSIFDKIEAEWIPLIGISYDAANERISVIFDKLDHAIEKPQEVTVEKEQDGIKAIEIVSAEDGSKNILRFKMPLKI